MRKAGCDSAVVCATSPYSRRIFEKMGMELMSELPYKDIEIQGEFPYKDIVFHSISSHRMKIKMQ